MPDTTIEKTDIDQFKLDIDSVLFKKQYFIEKIFPSFVETRDYFIVENRKVLGKSGAEKIGNAFGVVAVFSLDIETMQSFHVEGLIAYRCDLLNKQNRIVAQGRGSAVLKDHEFNPNTTIKVCTKRSYVDSILRFSNLSDMFYQDLEDMRPANIKTSTAQQLTKGPEQEDKSIFFPKNPSHGDGPATEKQKALLEKLIKRKMRGVERSRWLHEAETSTKFSASELISSFFLMDSR